MVLALAARGAPRSELGRLLDRLAFSAGDRDVILRAAIDADSIARALADARRPSEIAAAVGAAGPELVAIAGALGAEQAAAEWLERLRHVQLEIDGRDLLAAGIPEGPGIGLGLQAALAAKLDGHAAGKEQELQAALQGPAESRGDGG